MGFSRLNTSDFQHCDLSLAKLFHLQFFSTSPFRKWEEKIGKTSWSSLLGKGWNARTLQPRGTNANGKRHVPVCKQPAVQMSLVMCTPYVWKRCTRPVFSGRDERRREIPILVFPFTAKDDEPTDLCFGVSDTEQLVWLPSDIGGMPLCPFILCSEKRQKIGLGQISD